MYHELCDIMWYGMSDWRRVISMQVEKYIMQILTMIIGWTWISNRILMTETTTYKLKISQNWYHEQTTMHQQ